MDSHEEDSMDTPRHIPSRIGDNTYPWPDGYNGPTVSFSGNDLQNLRATAHASPQDASRDVVVTDTFTFLAPLPEWLYKLMRGEAADG